MKPKLTTATTARTLVASAWRADRSAVRVACARTAERREPARRHGREERHPARAGPLYVEHLLSLLHRHHQGSERQAAGARPDRDGEPDDPRRHAAVFYVRQEEGARRALRDDGGAADRQGRTRGAGPRTVRRSEHRAERPLCHAGAAWWHFARADVTAGVGFFAPTGRYRPAPATTSARACGATRCRAVAPSISTRRRSISLSTTAYWETHGKKEGEVHVENVSVSNVKVGQLLTLEGGIGKSFLHGAASIGVAYYAQWKMTADELESRCLRRMSRGPPGEAPRVRHRPGRDDSRLRRRRS